MQKKIVKLFYLFFLLIGFSGFVLKTMADNKQKQNPILSFFKKAVGKNQEAEADLDSAKSPSVDDKATKPQEEIASLAGGCFWCVEADFEKILGVKKVISGYTGGETANPSYESVSSGKTNHIEAVQVFFDPNQISYSQILDIFWKVINPLDDKGQFVDRGRQYTTAIFYHNETQKKIAEESKQKLMEEGPFKGQKIVTAIRAFTHFYKAEDYHQDYYKKNSARYKFYRWNSGRDQFLKKTWANFKSKLANKTEHPPSATAGENKPAPYFKPSKEEIKKNLSPLQYKVTQKDGTEPPFNNEFWDHKEEGIYVDIVSGEPLFSSLDKYDSKTGWPSFTKALVPENIVTKTDRKLIVPRTEVRSLYADSHLGHVFKDGPPPTGLRYCINSASLRFIPKDELESKGYKEFANLFEKQK